MTDKIPEALAVLDREIECLIDERMILSVVSMRKARAAFAGLYLQANIAQMLLRDMADAGFGDNGPSDDLRKALAAVEELK